MRPTFLGFETARKGLVANQKGMDIVGQNLTNINTSGYTRQRVDFVSNTIGTSGRFGKNAALAGQGVLINGVSQIRDSFLDKRFRDEYGDVGRYEKTYEILKDVESALDEVTSNGLKDALKNISNALNDFSKNPDQSTHANITLTAMKNLTQVIKQFGSKLDNILEQQKFDANLATDSFNSLVERIAELNKSISSDIFLSGQGYGPNELLDKRNELLDQLSKFGKIDIQAQNDGSVKVLLDGHTIVDGTNYENVVFTKNHDNTVTFSWQSTGKPINSQTGVFKGLNDMINGYGANAKGDNQNFEKGIPYYKDKINAFAAQLVSVFNSTIEVGALAAVYRAERPNTALPNNSQVQFTMNHTNPATIINITVTGNTIEEQSRSIVNALNNNATFAFHYEAKADSIGNITFTAKNKGVDNAFGSFTGWSPNDKIITEVAGVNAGQVNKVLFEPNDVNLVDASNIKISEIWANNPDYIITDLNNDGTGDNGYILALLDTFNKDYEYGDFKGTFEGYVNSYNATLGQQIEFNSTRMQATTAISEEMLNRRDSVSGVSMDEEGSNLMVFDKAYKAVSRLMTVMDEALDKLINSTGVVGR